MTRTTRSLSLLTAALLLAACQAAPVPATAPAAPVAAGTGRIMVVPSVARGGVRRLLAEIAPYSAASIHHLKVELTDDRAPGVVVASANVPQADLYNTITFGNLANGQTYTITAKAYLTATENGANLISIDGSSRVPLAVAQDDRPTLGNLVVTLKDRTFSGEADSAGLTVNGGAVVHDGQAPGAIAHSTLVFTECQDVNLSDGSEEEPETPHGIAVDADGDVFLTDFDRHVVWKLPDGNGSPEVFAGDLDTPGTFDRPSAIAVGPDGALYVGDADRVQRIANPGGTITTVAGADGDASHRPTDLEGSLPSAASARFDRISGLAFKPNGDLVVVDWGHALLKVVTPGGGVRNIRDAFSLSVPGNVAVGRDGQYYVAAANANQIVRVADDGTPDYELWAGGLGTSGYDDGPRLDATFIRPRALAFDPAGSLYVGNEAAIRRISPRGDVSTLAGLPGTAGNAPGSLYLNAGSPGTTRFSDIYGLAVGPDGRLFVADAATARVAFLQFVGI